eukprot:gb/GECH01008812.1/.p1 GENE.gb/GECH01008812.1/~~gb/GECH01008812.1/.p1  ORF type:complete len:214 (+),score=38.91 gb/GECH01008812.1/:1-642(+)
MLQSSPKNEPCLPNQPHDLSNSHPKIPSLEWKAHSETQPKQCQTHVFKVKKNMLSPKMKILDITNQKKVLRSISHFSPVGANIDLLDAGNGQHVANIIKSPCFGNFTIEYGLNKSLIANAIKQFTLFKAKFIVYPPTGENIVIRSTGIRNNTFIIYRGNQVCGHIIKDPTLFSTEYSVLIEEPEEDTTLFIALCVIFCKTKPGQSNGGGGGGG